MKNSFQVISNPLTNAWSFLPCILVLILSLFTSSYAQGVELVQAGSLEGTTFRGLEVRKLTQNVILKNGNVMLFCDTAYQFVATQNVEAYGHVRVNENGNFEVTGKKLVFIKATNIATVTGDVVLTTKDGAKLTTNILDYDFKNKVMHYYGGGEIIDKGSTLRSQFGHYDINAKVMTFKKDVRIKGQDFESESDTLRYDTQSKVAYFLSPTKIKSKDGNLVTERGEYNTATKKSKFTGRTSILKDDFSVTANQLDYDETSGYGYAVGNVKIISLKDSIEVIGEEAEYKGRSYLRVNDNAILKILVSGDTMLIRADTLLSIDDSIKKIRILRAYNRTKVLKSDFSAICDSLVYDRTDSLIYFYRDPVLWSNRSQLSGDSIHVTMRKNKIDKLFMRQNSFIISEDSARNLNQVKGRNMVAQFVESKIQRVDIDGNGESIYYAMDKDSIFVGINKISCSKMSVRFGDKNQPKTFTFIKKPDAQFIPPHKLEEPDKTLKGFRWRIGEMPTKSTVYTKLPPPAKSKPRSKREERREKRKEQKELKKERK
ncbi:MAG TPA: OstA-like protein [Cytophagales bacterium]|nr:OstA-like protein [Cytophagales bacterium]